MTQISFVAPFRFKGVVPASKAKFESFQKANPHVALMDLSEGYAKYFGNILGTQLTWSGTSSKNVKGKRWNNENWWKNYGILGISFMAPIGFKVPPVGTRIADPNFTSRLNRYGQIGTWVVSPTLNATTAFISKNL